MLLNTLVSIRNSSNVERESDWRKDVPFPWMESMFRPLEEGEVVVSDPDEKIIEMNATNWQLPEVFEKFSNPKTHRLRPVAIKVEELPRDVRCLLTITEMMEDIARYTEEILFCPILRQKGARIPTLEGSPKDYPNIIGGLAPIEKVTDVTWRPGKRILLVNNGRVTHSNYHSEDAVSICGIAVHEADHRKILELVKRGRLHSSHLSNRATLEMSAYTAQKTFLQRLEKNLEHRGFAQVHIQRNLEHLLHQTRKQITAIENLQEEGIEF